MGHMGPGTGLPGTGFDPPNLDGDEFHQLDEHRLSDESGFNYNSNPSRAGYDTDPAQPRWTSLFQRGRDSGVEGMDNDGLDPVEEDLRNTRDIEPIYHTTGSEGSTMLYDQGRFPNQRVGCKKCCDIYRYDNSCGLSGHTTQQPFTNTKCV